MNFRIYFFIFISVFFIASCRASHSIPTSSAPFTSTVTTAFPASEFYGDTWNTQFVRLSSDPRPSGTTTLNLLPEESSEFVMPVCGRIISEYGMRNGRMHVGIDIVMTLEQPIYNAFDGMVRMARTFGDYGKVVVIRHHNGLETVYSHLNSIAVEVNQSVKAGDLIGGGGRTGNATGVHLHFEVRFMGQPINPRLIIDFENCELKTDFITLDENSF